MSDLRARQQLNRGYNDGLARGMEIVLTPLLLGALGWWLDGILGTDPVLAIVLGFVGAAGIFVKLKLGYDKKMLVEEAGKPWSRPTNVDPTGAGGTANRVVEPEPIPYAFANLDGSRDTPKAPE